MVKQSHVGDGRPSFRGPLGIQNLPTDDIQRDRIGSEEERFPSPSRPRLIPASRASLVNTDQTVKNMQRGLLAYAVLIDGGRNEGVALIGAAFHRECRRIRAAIAGLHGFAPDAGDMA